MGKVIHSRGLWSEIEEFQDRMTGKWKITEKQIMANVSAFQIRKERLFFIPL